jgi:DNA modification methylase
MATGPGERTGVIYRDDNLARLREFGPATVDLIYLDPPFFSNKNYEVIWGDESEVRSFKDRWKGGIGHYIGWMRERVEQMHRVLKPTGSLYLHCDSNASHYLKVMLDEIFGEERFRNEIIWKRANSHNDPKRFGRISDTILYYAKGSKPTWNPQYTEYREDYYKSHFKLDENGRYWRTVPLDAPRHGEGSPNLIYEWRGKTPAQTRTWAVRREIMEQYERDERIRYTRTGTPTLIQYADEMPGVPLQNIWTDIPPVNPQARERLGYPTQKPEALLNRIVYASSNKGDVVLDPFCGCGTTMTVAHNLKRRWIGIDISPTAVEIIVQRMRQLGASAEVVGGIQRVDDLRDLDPHEFQNFVIKRVYGTHSPRKTSDMGIDGFSFMEKLPIQVKQSEHVGRNVVDNFETAIRRAKKEKGYIIAFSFTRGAYEEAARARSEGLEIALVEVAALFDAERDVAPRPGATQLENDLFQAARLAAADPSRIGRAPDLSADELIKSAGLADVT